METVVLYVVGVLVIALGLIVSIALHEIGHLVPAKLFGVKVAQYMVGFGRTLWSTRRGETEYGIKMLPLGGYVSMAGMYPPAKGHEGEGARDASTGFFQTLTQDARDMSTHGVDTGDEHRFFYNLPVWKRVVIMVAGPAMNLLIGIVLYAVLLMGFGVAQVSTTVGSVNECVVPAGSTQTECTDDDPLAPGAEAGVLPGDEIVAIDGEPIDTWAQATAIIRDSAGEPLDFTVLRDGDEVELEITPLLTERYVTDDEGNVVEDASGVAQTQEVGFVGIGAALENVQQPVTAVLPAVGENIASVVGIFATLPQRLVDTWNAAFGGDERDPNGPISVVGVGRIAGEIASLDAVPVLDRVSYLVGLLASLNIALFVLNLVPLMPLDGGHVAGALWEGLRRRVAALFKRRDPGPVDTAKLIPLTFTVTILLGGMSLLLAYADIVNPVRLFQ